MMRFIDLGKQIAVDESDEEWPRQFAFFNTVDSHFLEFDGEQVWDSWTDFEDSWKEHWGTVDPASKKELTRQHDRLKSLCHSWVPGLTP